MKTQLRSIAARLTNHQLIAQVQELARHERETTASLVAHLAELDARKLYLGQGCSSLYTYCVTVLHLSEGEAYMRMRAARLSRRFPVVVDKLESGALNLSTLKLLGPILTTENHKALLAEAEHKSKRQVEELVARVAPQPAVAASIRKLPVAPAAAMQPDALADAMLGAAPRIRFVGPALRIAAPEVAASVSPVTGDTEAESLKAAIQAAVAGAVAGAVRASASDALPAEPQPKGTVAAKPAVIAPLAPELYRIEFTANAPTLAKLRKAQDLLRHLIPTGDRAAIVDRALTMLIAHLEKTRLGSTDRPQAARAIRKGSRHLPAAVRRAV